MAVYLHALYERKRCHWTQTLRTALFTLHAPCSILDLPPTISPPRKPTMVLGSLSLLAIFLYLCAHPGVSVLVNHTIDDENGDESTYVAPSYVPYGLWAQGSTCDGCNINRTNANVNRAFDKTWHDSTYHAGEPERIISIQFTGNAVYVFTLLANQIPATTTFTNLTFYLDGGLVGNFIHEPDNSTGILYNVSVFSLPGLTNEPHEFEIRMGGGPKDSLILFDYVMYTTEEDATPSVSPFTTPSLTPISDSQSSSVAKIVRSTATSRPTSTSLGTVFPQSSTFTSTNTTHHWKQGSNKAASIAEAILGGLALVTIASMASFCVLRRWRRRRSLSKREVGLAPLKHLFSDTSSSHPTGTCKLQLI